MKIRIFAILLAVVTIASCLASCQRGDAIYESEDEIYAYFDSELHTELCYDMEEYEDVLEKIENSFDDDTSEIIKDMLVNFVEPEDYVSDMIEEANSYIAEYFEEVYSISVQDELDELTVKMYDFDNKLVGAYVYDEEGHDGKTIYLHTDYNEKDVFDSEESIIPLRDTYIHETLHYLGSCNSGEGIDWMYVTEGITDALTYEVAQFAGYTSNADCSAYRDAVSIARQLFIADTDLIIMMIEGTGMITSEELVEYFDDKTFEGFGDAFQKSVTLMLGSAIQLEASDTEEYYHISQHFAGEYLKYCGLSEKEQLKVADYFLVPFKELAE